MGASGWTYYAPYQEDLEHAFQTLRQQVFESKKYDHFREPWEYKECQVPISIDIPARGQTEEWMTVKGSKNPFFRFNWRGFDRPHGPVLSR
jgi:hypothetical protein